MNKPYITAILAFTSLVNNLFSILCSISSETYSILGRAFWEHFHRYRIVSLSDNAFPLIFLIFW